MDGRLRLDRDIRAWEFGSLFHAACHGAPGKLAQAPSLAALEHVVDDLNAIDTVATAVDIGANVAIESVASADLPRTEECIWHAGHPYEGTTHLTLPSLHGTI